jgi:hypothetical protein
MGGSSSGGFLSGNLEYADSFNLALIVRTRRPTKFKIGTNCKNKPMKHSQDIDEEDNLEMNNHFR